MLVLQRQIFEDDINSLSYDNQFILNVSSIAAYILIYIL